MRRLSSSTQLRHRKSFTYLICFIYLVYIVHIIFPLNNLIRFDSADQAFIPSGFYEILNETGVNVFQKRYPGGMSDFVTRVDLQAATIRNLTGVVNGVSIGRKTLQGFWQDAVSENRDNLRAQVVVNGTFFGNGASSTTTAAFGLKVRNQIISYGYGLNEYPGLNKTLAFHSFAGKAQIQDYTVQTFDSSIPDVIGALAAQADKSAASRLGRTFAGVIDRDRDSVPETVLFFSSAGSTQANAAAVLRNFGATEAAMLDGGGSTGLIVDGTPLIATDRTLPHAIAIYSNKPKDVIVAANNQCLDATGFSGFGSALRSPGLRLSGCNSSASQRWSLIKGTLQNANDRCLTMKRENSDGERKVQLQRCNQSLEQGWTYENGTLKAANNQCLDAGELSVASNVGSDIEVVLRFCNGNDSQQWQRLD
jgi:hypothetical protein